jgi:hypothetical protein
MLACSRRGHHFITRKDCRLAPRVASRGTLAQGCKPRSHSQVTRSAPAVELPQPSTCDGWKGDVTGPPIVTPSRKHQGPLDGELINTIGCGYCVVDPDVSVVANQATGIVEENSAQRSTSSQFHGPGLTTAYEPDGLISPTVGVM